MGYKVGVTTGLYGAARGEELAEAVRKLGYGLTRGARSVEIAMDVPHEVTYTDGRVIRQIAKKQGIEVLLHGSLTIPMCIPERSDYRDAQDHMEKSVRSAVYCGARYVDFHSCLNIWLELITYTSRKMTMSFCDHRGHFISQLLKENEKLRKWFVEKKGNLYISDILTKEESTKINSLINEREEKWFKEEIRKRMEEANIPYELIERILQTGIVPSLVPEKKDIEYKANRILEQIKFEKIQQISKIQRDTVQSFLYNKLSRGGKWDSEELRAVVGIVDGYHIMAHHLFYTQDPLWKEMSKMYEKELRGYNLDPSDMYSLDKAWRIAEENNDRGFKEFYYAVVGAKYLEGHMERLLNWIENDFIKKEIPAMNIPQSEKDELIRNARRLVLAIENADARDPSHAGLYLLWHPKQIYVAVKRIREKLKTNRVEMLIDFEHMATQGLDPVREMEDTLHLTPDMGAITISAHSNAPNPSHAHIPLELGDIRIYQLLWSMRKTGFGKNKDVYLIYERGGGDDPFKQSVDVLRLCAKYLEQNVPPEKLPPEFFGFKGPIAGDIRRQMQIIRDHMYEPLKDLLEMPEEEFSMLSSAAIKKGKRPEQWKKAEFR